jgi:hypothetical protein
MRTSRDEPILWHFLPAKPGIENSFKRWNLVVIALLVFVVFGAFIAGLGSNEIHAPVAGMSAPSAQHAVHHG